MNPRSDGQLETAAASGMAIETRLGLCVIVVLVCAFGFLVIHKFDLRRQQLASINGAGTKKTPPAETSPSDAGGSVPGARASEDTAPALDSDASTRMDSDPTPIFGSFESLSEPAEHSATFTSALPTNGDSAAVDAQVDPDDAGKDFVAFEVADTASRSSSLSADDQPTFAAEAQPQPSSLKSENETEDPFAGFSGTVADAQTTDTNSERMFPDPDQNPLAQLPIHETPTVSDAESADSDPFQGLFADSGNQQSPDVASNETPATTDLSGVTAETAFEAPEFPEFRPENQLPAANEPAVEFGQPFGTNSPVAESSTANSPEDSESGSQNIAQPEFAFGSSEEPVVIAMLDPVQDDNPFQNLSSNDIGALDEPAGADLSFPEQNSASQNIEAQDNQAQPADSPPESVAFPSLPPQTTIPLSAQSYDADPQVELSDRSGSSVIQQTSATSQPVAICEVLPNDNYWSISKRVYGSARYFSALALFNRNRISDPKKLRPGMKVLTPEPEILEGRYPELFTDFQSKPRLPTGYFLNNGAPAYRIGERETLSEISSKHLGRASRWVQIYRMNQNVLKDPNKLKPGTVIALPDDATDVHLVP